MMMLLDRLATWIMTAFWWTVFGATLMYMYLHQNPLKCLGL